MGLVKSIISKGFLGKALSLISKGWLSKDTSQILDPICDYPHAVKMATMGRLGATVGTASRGSILRVCIVQQDDVRRTTGPGNRGFREEKKKQKKIIVTVYCGEREYTETKYVPEFTRVTIDNIDVVEKDGDVVSVKLIDLKN
jgi:hypothetical protein